MLWARKICGLELVFLSLNDMYEDIKDKEEITEYECIEKHGGTQFHSFEDIVAETQERFPQS
jgi:hypothetical protein